MLSNIAGLGCLTLSLSSILFVDNQDMKIILLIMAFILFLAFLSGRRENELPES